MDAASSGPGGWLVESTTVKVKMSRALERVRARQLAVRIDPYLLFLVRRRGNSRADNVASFGCSGNAKYGTPRPHAAGFDVHRLMPHQHLVERFSAQRDRFREVLRQVRNGLQCFDLSQPIVAQRIIENERSHVVPQVLKCFPGYVGTSVDGLGKRKFPGFKLDVLGRADFHGTVREVNVTEDRSLFPIDVGQCEIKGQASDIVNVPKCVEKLVSVAVLSDLVS